MNNTTPVKNMDSMFGVYDPHDCDEQSNADETARMLQITKQIIETRLSERQRQIVHMYFYEMKRSCDIAKELGVNRSTVSRTLSRALKNIKRYTELYDLYKQQIF